MNNQTPNAVASPLKTIVVCFDYGHVNGGAAKVAISGSLGLAARGYRVIYFAPMRPMDERLEAAGIETICLDQQDLAGASSPLRGALRGIWNVDAARRLTSLPGDLDAKSIVIYQHGW